MTAKHRRPRTVAAPLTALALTAALVAPASAAAAGTPDDTAFVPGVGSASAGVFRVALRSSGVNIGVGLAQTRARYAGAQGNAESVGADLGMFDMIGKAPIACGTAPGAILPEGSRPQRLVVSSGGGADERRSASFGAGTPVEIGSQSGSATPNSKADAGVGGVRVDIPGLLTVIGGTASSGAHLIPGKQRSATATSGLGRIVLAGGLVELEGLRWTATERTGAVKSSDGEFSLGAISVGGRRYPAPDAASLAEGLAAANKTLEPIGLALRAPRVQPTTTGKQVTPLRLSISSTPELRTLLAAVLDGVQPVRSQLLELVSPLQVSPDCGFAKALGFGYLVADLALVVMGDGGGVDIDFGGARAGTDATAYVNPLNSGFGALTPPGLPVTVGQFLAPPQTAPLVPAFAVPPAAQAATSQAPFTSDSTTTVAQVPVAAVCRSSHLANGDGCTNRGLGVLAGWLALTFVVILAAADFVRRRMV